MKKLLSILILNLLLSAESFAIDITLKKHFNHELTPKPTKDYFVINEEIVRAGKQSQKFILTHGGCYGEDCIRGSQRSERKLKLYHRSAKKFGKPVYYAWSIFFPQELKDGWVGAKKVLLGQVKMGGVGLPIWHMYSKGKNLNFRIDHSTITGVMNCGPIKFGKWTDIIIKVDYAKEKKSLKDYKTFEVWLNGKYIKKCTHIYPIVKKKTFKESINSSTGNKGKMNLRYGIYRYNVGSWLMSHNKNTPKDKKIIVDPDGGEHAVHKPFKLDWEVQLPTLIIYYDEMRIGKTKDEVDISLQSKPVD